MEYMATTADPPHRSEMNDSPVPVYLDHNATTPVDPRVVEAMIGVQHRCFGNPSSQHAAGRAARQALEEARESILERCGGVVTRSPSDRLIFTSGGTEANNLAVRGLCGRSPGRVVVSQVEHPSVLATAAHLSAAGFTVVQAPVSPEGVICLDSLAELLTPDTRLVSVMLANHETGVLQPIADVARMCRQRDIPLHTDAVQAIGKMAVDFDALGVDAMSLAPHKFHGPRGIGALILRRGLAVLPILYGGSQQLGMRPGTEPVALAVGMCQALELWHQEADARRARLQSLRDRLEQTLVKELPGSIVLGCRVPRVPQTLCLAVPGLDRQALVLALDRAGLACSSGAACASGSTEPSPVLKAMGLSDDVVRSAIRLSVGATTTEADIDRGLAITIAEVHRLQQRRRTESGAAE